MNVQKSKEELSTSWRHLSYQFKKLEESYDDLLIPLILLLVSSALYYIVENYSSTSDYFFSSDKVNSKGEFLKVLLSALAGIAGIIAIIQGARRVKAMEKGNVDTRFNNAVAHLGNSNSTVVLGGIHALHQIAKENENYRQIIHDLFCSYLRENSGKLYEDSIEVIKEKSESEEMSNMKCPVILQVIVNYLFKQDNDGETIYQLFNSDLSYCMLIRCDWRYSNLKKCTFSSSVLVDCIFDEAELTDCSFIEGELINCRFFQAKLKDVVFLTSLDNCKFGVAKLNQCRFSGPELKKCGFNGAKLKKCVFDAELIECWFIGAFLNNCSFQEEELDEGSKLINCNFETARLINSNLDKVDVDELTAKTLNLEHIRSASKIWE